MSQFLVDFWMEAGHQQDQVMIASWELSAPTHPHSPERKESVELEFIINHAYMIKSS